MCHQYVQCGTSHLVRADHHCGRVHTSSTFSCSHFGDTPSLFPCICVNTHTHTHTRAHTHTPAPQAVSAKLPHCAGCSLHHSVWWWTSLDAAQCILQVRSQCDSGECPAAPVSSSTPGHAMSHSVLLSSHDCCSHTATCCSLSGCSLSSVPAAPPVTACSLVLYVYIYRRVGVSQT